MLCDPILSSSLFIREDNNTSTNDAQRGLVTFLRSHPERESINLRYMLAVYMNGDLLSQMACGNQSYACVIYEESPLRAFKS